MSQFVQITGANPQATFRFSRIGNALAGLIGHSRRPHETAAIYSVEGLDRAPSPPFALLLVYFYGLQRHFDPVYEDMT